MSHVVSCGNSLIISRVWKYHIPLKDLNLLFLILYPKKNKKNIADRFDYYYHYDSLVADLSD